MTDALAHDRSPRRTARSAPAALGGLVLAGLAACSGGDGPAPASALGAAVPGAPPTVLERPTAFPPALRATIEALDPARDVWECEVVAGLASATLARLAERLAQGAPIDAAWSANVAGPRFESSVASSLEAAAPDAAHVGAALAVRRFPAGDAAPGADAGDGLPGALAALLARFDAARGVRLTFELDRADVDGPEAFTTAGPVQLFGHAPDGALLQQNARWSCRWRRAENAARLVALDVEGLEEVRGPVTGRPLFEDCTRSAIGADPGYEALVLSGVPHWNASLDKTLDTAVFGHNGLAVGDADGDGLEDLYVCQAGGLPNQLFVHQPDGTAVDRAAELGVDVLDFTRSALFVDLDGDGDQDLVLATSKALVVLAGAGRDGFRRALSMPITGTALAAGDADGDGRVDLYVCRYSRPESLWPLPYHDANNGPSNVLLKNLGNLRFEVATEPLGLDAANTRYSFAAGWLDFDGDLDQDLYVANDFGRNVLYVNEGGRFREVATQSGAEDMAAGMSVAWGDFDGDLAPDLYVANMFSAAGSRLAHQPAFRGPATAEHYRRHARGNTLLRNRGDGTFEDVSVLAGVEQGRWAWGSAFVDVDNDGRLDLAVANGYLTNAGPDLLCSFFWRRVVGLSPDGPDEVVAAYEDGWAALSELQREYSFNGSERNCLFLNTGGPRFADASAVSGIDFPDDGRALAVVDWDDDGALDLWISARTAPRLRLLRNTNPGGSRSVVLRLQDRVPNRDAIGARVEIAGHGVRWVVAGDGFLSQSTGRLHFGLGLDGAASEALVTWSDGTRETFAGLAAGGRFLLQRGRGRAVREERPSAAAKLAAAPQTPLDPAPRALVRLAEPLPLFGLTAVDADGGPRALTPAGGRPMCVVLWEATSAPALAALEHLGRNARELRAVADVIALEVGPPERRRAAAAAFAERVLSFELAFAGDGSLATLELLLRSVFEQPPPTCVPTALVLDAQGRLTALARGRVDASELLVELGRKELDPEALRALATPFAGTWLAPPARRSMQGIAAVLRRHERLALAADYLGLALSGAGDPADDDDGGNARARLADSQELLGRELVADERWEEAAEAFGACLELDPERPLVHVELGNALRGLERPDDALRHYRRALELDPESADAHYSVGLMHALAGSFADAERSFAEAVRFDPERPLAHYNLGVSLANQQKHDQAARSVARSLELDPDYLPATLTLAAIHGQRGDVPAAIGVYRTGLERHPDEPRLLYGLGRACVAAGDRAGAETTLAALRRADTNLAARLAGEVERMP